MVEHLSQERGKPIAKNFDFYRREIRRIRKEESKDAARMFDTLLVELSGKIDAAKDLGTGQRIDYDDGMCISAGATTSSSSCIPGECQDSVAIEEIFGGFDAEATFDPVESEHVVVVARRKAAEPEAA